MSWIYYVAREALRLSLFLLTRWQVKGRENVPNEGPLLIVANHIHLADPPVLGISVSRKVTFMAKEGLFRSRFSAYFMRRLGAFPTHQRGSNQTAPRQALRVLAEGQALVVFPEGTRKHNRQLGNALPGSALIACYSGAPIRPVGITGTEQLRGIAWILRRPRVTINIGRPFYLTPTNGKPTKNELADLTDSMMKRIAELLPQEYRGNYTV